MATLGLTQSTLPAYGKDIYYSPPPSPVHSGHMKSVLFQGNKNYSKPLSSGSVSKQVKEAKNDEPSEATNFDMSIAKEAVCSMGVPEETVQLVIDVHKLNDGVDFTDVTKLYLAADEVSSDPAKLANLREQLQKSACQPANKLQLQTKVKKLVKENEKLKKRKTCRSCKQVDLAASGITFLPCGHFITCETCSEKFDDCPACGKNIMGTVRTFLS